MPHIRSAAMFIAGGLVGMGVLAGSAMAQPCDPTWVTDAGQAGFPTGYMGAIGMYQGRLFSGGSFNGLAGDPTLNYLAQYDFGTQTWSQVGSGIDMGISNAFITSFLEYDFGNGPELVVGGFFFEAGGVTGTKSLAAWNGSSWRALGTDFNPTGPEAVWSMAEWNGNLYIGGGFTTVAGQPAFGVAEWNGTQWRAISSDIQPVGGSPVVFELFVYDDGTGEKLYAGGRFTSLDAAGPMLARWNGTSWESVGTNLGGRTVNSDIQEMVAFDDGTGTALYVGGFDMRLTDTLVRCNVAKWNGTTWTDVGGLLNGRVYGLEVFDAGDGEALYVAGTQAALFNSFAKWNGTSWTAAGGGVLTSISGGNASVYQTMVDGDRLWLAGNFTTVAGGTQAATGIAAFEACQDTGCPGDWDGSGGIDGDDITAFFVDWQAGEADIDGSGGTDGDDITFFFVRWQAGC